MLNSEAFSSILEIVKQHVKQQVKQQVKQCQKQCETTCGSEFDQLIHHDSELSVACHRPLASPVVTNQAGGLTRLVKRIEAKVQEPDGSEDHQKTSLKMMHIYNI